jgi:hypothetical protein
MTVRGNGPVLFFLFFALAVLLAGGMGRLGGPVLEGTADLPTVALFLAALAGLALSLLVAMRILYLATWRARVARKKAE